MLVSIVCFHTLFKTPRCFLAALSSFSCVCQILVNSLFIFILLQILSNFPVMASCVSHSVMSNSLQPCDCVACQAPLSMGFSRQESWSGLSFPSPGGLPNPGIESQYPPLQADSLVSEPLDTPVI